MTKSRRSKSSGSESILPSYRNKHLMLWFVKNGNKLPRVSFFEGFSNIFYTRTLLSPVFFVHLPYNIQRIGFCENVYEVNNKEYLKKQEEPILYYYVWLYMTAPKEFHFQSY